MYFSSIEPATIVDISYCEGQALKDEDGNLNTEQYRTQVISLKTDRIIEVKMPYEGGKMIVLEVDKEFDLFFTSPKGLFSAKAVSMSRYRRASIPVLSLKIVGKVEKVQRREAFRIKASLDIAYKVINPETAESAMSLERTDKFLNKYGVSLNISAGGMKFLTREPVEKDTTLFVEIGVPNGEGEDDNKILFNPRRDGGLAEQSGRPETYFYTVFNVLDCNLNDKGYYEVRGNFIDIEKKDKEKIIKYIFWLERQYRKKEKEENA